MPISPLPRMIAPALTDISGEMLHNMGIRLLMLDFDNTIVPYTTDIPASRMEQWLREMSASDITLCVVSNSRHDRVPAFCSRYGLDCITHAKKPFSKGIRACLTKYGIPPTQAALAGDQIFTDTLGANSCGVTSILVEAIDNHSFWLKARHVLEMPFILVCRKRSVHL